MRWVDAEIVLLVANVKVCPTCGHAEEGEPIPAEGVGRRSVKVRFVRAMGEFQCQIDGTAEWERVDAPIAAWGVDIPSVGIVYHEKFFPRHQRGFGVKVSPINPQA